MTSIFVDDQDQAERFYTEVLGFQVKTSAPTARGALADVVSPEEPDGWSWGHIFGSRLVIAVTDEGQPVSKEHPMTHMIEATGVVERFRDTTGLDGLELFAEQGAILAVLGPNGAGKTTFVPRASRQRLVARSLVWSAVLLLVFGSIAVARYRRG